MINTQVSNAKDTDIVMPTYNLIEDSDTYWETLGSLCQYYRDEPVLNNVDAIIDFPNDNNSDSSKF